MNLRVAILVLADRHNLAPAAGRRLRQLAALDAPPPSLLRYLPLGMAVLAAVLAGLCNWLWLYGGGKSLSATVERPKVGRIALPLAL